MGKKSKRKGGRGERQALALLKEWWDADFFRTPGSGSFATRGGRHRSLAMNGDITTDDPSFPFCPEVKNAEKWDFIQLLTAPKSDLYSYWDQAVSQCEGTDLEPLLMFTRNHKPFFFMMRKSSLKTQPLVLEITIQGEPVVIGLMADLMGTKEHYAR